MKTAKYALTVALGLIALVTPSVVRADEVTVTADMTFNTCAAATGCQETFDVSYGWNNTTNTLASPVVLTAMGDLGSNFFSTPFVGGVDPILVSLGPALNVVIYEASDPLSDVFILTLSETGSSLAPGSYTETNGISGSQQFLTELVCNPDDALCQSTTAIAPSSAEVIVSPAPEPSAGMLLAAGLFGLVAGTWRRKRLA